MDDTKRLKKRHNFLLNFLLGGKYELKEENNLGYANWLWSAVHLLESVHKDAMIVHYFENRTRTMQAAQNIFHGRYALVAALSGNSEVTLDQLKELCVERKTS